MLSDMAFWNPSEIIGSNPRPLDYSLYRRIITHRAWNEGLRPLGYCPLEEDLMYQVGNKPYINLNYSFYSLIPDSLPEDLKKRLVVYYRERLQEDLSAHDKIEFEIVFSCYDFMTEENSRKLLLHGFTEEERKQIVAEVKRLTMDAVLKHNAILSQDKGSLSILEFTRMEIEKIGENCNNAKELIETVKWLLEAITRYERHSSQDRHVWRLWHGHSCVLWWRPDIARRQKPISLCRRYRRYPPSLTRTLKHIPRAG